MMTEEELYQKIETYLRDEMSVNERMLFEQELEKNTPLREELELQREMQFHFNEEIIGDDVIPDNKYTQDLKTFIDSDEAVKIKRKLDTANKKYALEVSSKANYKKYFKLVAAAIVLVLVSRVGLYLFNNSNTLYDDYYSNADLPSLVKRDDSQSLLYKGVSDFNNKNYNKAITAFESYKGSEVKVDTLMYLYLGASYLELKNKSKAIEAFDVVANSELLDRSKGLWFKALAYLKLNDKENARLILEKIIKSSSNFKYKEANELLEKL